MEFTEKQRQEMILRTAASGKYGRRELLNLLISQLLSPEQCADNSVSGEKNRLRSQLGQTVSFLIHTDALGVGENGILLSKKELPVVLRESLIEGELLRLIREKPRTKAQLKSLLSEHFGTDKTKTKADDGQLYTYIGQILKRQTDSGTLRFDGEIYSPAFSDAASAADPESTARLRDEFLILLHRKGGEYFEDYLMTLLGKHAVKSGKRVAENIVLGGSDDGGIDGRLQTIDTFGFRDTLLVQAKNIRGDIPETEVRGFFGAVCAARGSRGLFVTTSRFHESAQRFLKGIDNCAGLDGYGLFDLALALRYGISEKNGLLTVDLPTI
ncbi:MAG: restriction endonuclease [Clostridia bacterium]|nr:restriction endonuclease [Clostridia bacterium]